MKRLKKDKSIREQVDKEVKPLTEDENIDTLDEYLEEEEGLQDDTENMDTDDPWAQEKQMRIRRHRSQMTSIW